LYREVLHVPLLINASGLRARKVDAYASLVDIAPTLASIAAIERSSRWTGINLLSAAENKNGRAVLSQMLRRPEHTRAPLQAIVENGWHYIVHQHRDKKHTEELYHFEEDVFEKNDLSAAEPDRMAAFRRLLNVLNSNPIEGGATEVTVPMDKDTLEQLKSLGYVE
jgi:arylsulfatase A-like enzyme